MPATPMPAKSEHEWAFELRYIAYTVIRHQTRQTSGFERSSFLAYCRAQQACAMRDGQHAVAQSIARIVQPLEN